MERLMEWLPENVPADDTTTIVHGDFGLNNLMLRRTDITDAGLGRLEFLPRLEELRLEDTNITDEGIRSITMENGPGFTHGSSM